MAVLDTRQDQDKCKHISLAPYSMDLDKALFPPKITHPFFLHETRGASYVHPQLMLSLQTQEKYNMFSWRHKKNIYHDSPLFSSYDKILIEL